jgi:ATP-dependent RNA helicase RhlE
VNFKQFSFDRRISDAVKTVGYTTPAPILQQAIPIVLGGCDVLGLARTGTTASKQKAGLKAPC